MANNYFLWIKLFFLNRSIRWEKFIYLGTFKQTEQQHKPKPTGYKNAKIVGKLMTLNIANVNQWNIVMGDAKNKIERSIVENVSYNVAT